MRRFLVSYGNKKDIEGVQYSDGSINLDDTWIPSDFVDIVHLEKVLSQKGTKRECEVHITWIDGVTE